MNKRKLHVKSPLKVVLIIIFSLLIIFTAISLINYYVDLHNNKKLNDDLVKEVFEESDFIDNDDLSIDFKKLLSINKDTVGWIIYNDKKINYPVVQGKDNDYYINRSFDKKYNQAGSIFMDYRNESFDDQNVVLFGHSMLNGSMFGSLRDLLDNDYFNTDENNYIKIITTNNEIITYQIFSYYIIDAEEYYITTSFDNDNSFINFLNTIQKRSLKKFKVKLDVSDSILTLSTCYGTGDTNQRKVVHAVRIFSEDI